MSSRRRASPTSPSALAFYTEKLGWDVRADVTVPELGNYRWLTVGPPNQPEVSVSLNAGVIV
jgi:hypothetical protein